MPVAIPPFASIRSRGAKSRAKPSSGRKKGSGAEPNILGAPTRNPEPAEMEKRHEFYSRLYQQYATDLLKLAS